MSDCGLLRHQAVEASALGWTRPELFQLHYFAGHHRLSVTALHRWGIVLNDRFIWYRGGNMRTLALAILRPSSLSYETVCYCDGSGTTGDDVAGIGVLVQRPGFQAEFIAENIGVGTNNRAELAAAWRALKAVPDVTERVKILTDSQYTIGALTKDWARNANVELIEAIRTDLALRQGQVTFEHVDGHSGVEGNEIADQLAKIGRELVTRISALPL